MTLSLKNTLKALLIVMPFLFTSCISKSKEMQKVKVLTYQKTQCYGSCPVYSITFYSDNSVLVNPTSNFIVSEKSNGKLKKGTVENLLNYAERINFWSLKKEYNDALVSDLPSTFITIFNKDQNKKIKVRTNAPPELKELLIKIENIIKTIQWKAVSTAKKY
jgi:hypothetical protein